MSDNYIKFATNFSEFYHVVKPVRKDTGAPVNVVLGAIQWKLNHHLCATMN